MLKDRHDASMKDLLVQHKKLQDEYDKVKKNNSQTEEKLRKEYKKSSDNLNSNVLSYDQDVTNQTIDNTKTKRDYDDTMADLNQIKEEYNMRLEEKRKRDEIAAIMQKKNEEQQAKMDRLERASEYIQAHWKGMLARKEADKARKKGKKGKKKQK